VFALIAFSGLITLASAHNLTIPPNTFLGSPLFNTKIGFTTTQTFSDVYRTGDANSTWQSWWFIDGYAFQAVNLNISITQFFVADVLEFSVTGTNAGVLKVYNPSDGEPVTATGVSTYTFDPATAITTLNYPVAGTFTVDWNAINNGGSGGDSTPAPSTNPDSTATPDNSGNNNNNNNGGGGGALPTATPITGPPYIPDSSVVPPDFMLYGEIGVLAIIGVVAIAGVSTHQTSTYSQARRNMKRKAPILGAGKRKKRKNLLG